MRALRAVPEEPDEVTLHAVYIGLGFDPTERVIFSTKILPDGRFESKRVSLRQLHGWTPLQEREVWFSPQSLRDPLPEGGRGKVSDVVNVRTLHADLDVKSGAFRSERECDQVVARLESMLGAGCAFRIYSGGGVQPLWRIADGDITAEPESGAPSLSELERWVTLFKRWHALVEQVSCEVARRRVTVDNTADLARILRCPGSINTKDRDRYPDGRPVRTVRGTGEPVTYVQLANVLDRAGIDAVPGGSRATRKASAGAASAFLDALPNGQMSACVRSALDRALTALTPEGHGDGGRHESLTKHQPLLLRLGESGEPGVPTALAEYRTEFVAVVGPDRGDATARSEFDRMLEGAAAIVAGDPASDDVLATAALVREAFTPGGAWHPDTPDGMHAKLGWHQTAPPDDSPPSWEPVDLAGALDAEPPTPMCLVRTDGVALMYPGKVHSVHGESESGKSWLVQHCAVQAILAGGSALYVDFESDARDVAGRLMSMGVPKDVLLDRSRFAYVRPEVSTSVGRERAAFEAILAREFTVAVIDGVTDSMGMFGYSIKDNDDIAKWLRELPRAVARSTGAAVAMVDHVTKDPESRGRNAIGGQHKMAGVDGAAFVVEPRTAFAVGIAGVISVRIAKDRAGEVRRHGGAWRKSDRTQPIAEFHLDATEPGRIVARLEAPENVGTVSDVDKSKPGTTSDGAGAATKFRPTYFMEKVSLYWEETELLTDRSTTKTVAAMCAERKAAEKPLKRDRWRDAITLLVEEGYATFVVGARESHEHTVAKPYRQASDPLCDQYSAAVARSGGKLEITAEDLAESDADGTARREVDAETDPE